MMTQELREWQRSVAMVDAETRFAADLGMLTDLSPEMIKYLIPRIRPMALGVVKSWERTYGDAEPGALYATVLATLCRDMVANATQRNQEDA